LLLCPIEGGAPVQVYGDILGITWSSDGRLVYFSRSHAGMTAFGRGRTYALAVPRGSVLPKIPAGGFRSEAEIAQAAVQLIEAADFAPGPTPEVYAFSRETVQRNVYRIPMPETK
jgi:hypothetical protein